MPQIGPYTLTNAVALAPMAGVTDLPFRQLCARLGAGLVVSEMVNSNPRLRNTDKTRLRTRHDAEIEPRSVQIAGNDPQQMAAAARYNVALGAQVIDINMGCPAKKVCRKAAGSALLADEPLVLDILQAVVAAVQVPVTLKIRTGSSPQARNGVSIARIAEDAGVAALAVHGRTRACAFRGRAEYDTIADIVAAVDIPVFANGDIDSAEKAEAVLRHTGAAGVMVGRAAQGRPWLCGQIAARLATGSTPPAPSLAQQVALLHDHVSALHLFYGDFLGPRIARKHVGWFLQHQPQWLTHRAAFNALDDSAAQLHMIDQLFTGTTAENMAA
ncbi:MAG: tRNA dihydrouridine synthase DusB [Haliea sp.]|uniref:tRNA dihydrouridine synthase DusB n=1 Tax=Haliea sp. TaxID=1932666 RepID=UPI000C5ED2F7|nr:tRNA dihydrouridine synthase DusB [Haliea sp.]MBM69376.1 tRNA dihydrouridine synthase DusB [Haliea sp.]|tara:strand:- start:4119 stop:5105 length:987 start_codon:yes stop_codon:yes gene_type:complete